MRNTPAPNIARSDGRTQPHAGDSLFGVLAASSAFELRPVAPRAARLLAFVSLFVEFIKLQPQVQRDAAPPSSQVPRPTNLTPPTYRVPKLHSAHVSTGGCANATAHEA